MVLLHCRVHPPTQAQGVGGFTPNAPLGGCLCLRPLYDELLNTVSTNPLARSAGVTTQQVTNS